MSQIQEQEFFDHIVKLDDEERKEPILVVERFFADYRLNECRQMLWAMVEACLTTDNTLFGEPEERADLLTQYKSFQLLLEACYLLLDRAADEAVETGE